MQDWQNQILEKFSLLHNNDKRFRTLQTEHGPVDDISVGDIIEMTRTGKEFLVESITPSGIVLKECTKYVSFSRSALNERLKRNSAIHKSI
jgi:hypothetical protein